MLDQVNARVFLLLMAARLVGDYVYAWGGEEADFGYGGEDGESSAGPQATGVVGCSIAATVRPERPAAAAANRASVVRRPACRSPARCCLLSPPKSPRRNGHRD